MKKLNVILPYNTSSDFNYNKHMMKRMNEIKEQAKQYTIYRKCSKIAKRLVEDIDWLDLEEPDRGG